MTAESEQQHMLTPWDSMDDITAVSSGKAIEAVNTEMITKDIELSSKTIISILAGFIIGVILCVMLVGVVGLTVGVAIVMACVVAVPLMAVGTVKDATEELRWRRALHSLQSRKIEGEVFYANSVHPENIIDLEEMIVH